MAIPVVVPDDELFYETKDRVLFGSRNLGSDDSLSTEVREED